MAEYKCNGGAGGFAAKSDVMWIDAECLVVDKDMGYCAEPVHDANWERVFGNQSVFDVDYAAGRRCTDMMADMRRCLEVAHCPACFMCVMGPRTHHRHEN